MLTSWPFVLSLVTLIVNDAWLKASFPGLVTGKLSDLAGIVVIALLASARFPSRPLLVWGVIAGGFAWWKSPFSQPLIDALHGYAIPVARTVDFTDLLVLPVLPACTALARRRDAFKLPGAGARWLRVPLILATAFAVVATSLPPPASQSYQVRAFESSAPLKREAIVKALAEVAAGHRFKCVRCEKPDQGATYGRKGMYFEYEIRDAHVLAVRTYAEPYGEKGMRKLEKFNAEIKQRLREIQPGLEYTEILGGPSR